MTGTNNKNTEISNIFYPTELTAIGHSGTQGERQRGPILMHTLIFLTLIARSSSLSFFSQANNKFPKEHIEGAKSRMYLLGRLRIVDLKLKSSKSCVMRLEVGAVKPRPHQQQCPNNIVECYKLNDSLDNAAVFFSATMSNKISSFRQSRNKLNVFNLFRHCRKGDISFDIVAETAENGNIVAKIGNNVEATFDFVEKTTFYNRIVRHCCRLWQQSRMSLRQSRT